MTEPIIAAAEAGDAGELLTLQRAAYVSEAQIYGDPLLPPLVETIAALDAEIAAGGVLKAVLGNRIVGTGRARLEGDTWHLGRIAVAPDMQGRGIGTLILTALEARAPEAAAHCALFTGFKSEANLRLYERNGYQETHRGPGRPGVELVHLAKPAA
ncbi:GNAT family N-acetyltransferase [Glycomyces buryatensis]|uniref:GNAT family N-acetyltransferase n=1 Tax=Glycomyces buryatensis TaxID=2570927 RepID=A0A4S8QGN0_9ACTN|nr:GNAT family N-acetyltransferase [Glycomyces buryatensis]THV43550.1 GNAT family N-acetyltransferase [Glycomyces buryatensis]